MRFPVFALFLGTALLAPALVAQQAPDLAQGLSPYGTYQDSRYDSVNLSTGNVSLHIPIIAYPQKGRLALQYWLQADGKNWTTSYRAISQEEFGQGGGGIFHWIYRPTYTSPVFLNSSLSWGIENQLFSFSFGDPATDPPIPIYFDPPADDSGPDSGDQTLLCDDNTGLCITCPSCSTDPGNPWYPGNFWPTPSPPPPIPIRLNPLKMLCGEGPIPLS